MAIDLYTGEQIPDVAPPQGVSAQLPQQNIQPNQSEIGSFVNTIKNAYSPGLNTILGSGDALAHMMSLGYLNPHSGTGLPYEAGRVAGNIGGFLGGGELLDAARAGIEGIPAIGGIAKTLGGEGLAGAARRILGAGIGGAATDSDNRTQGGLEGLTLGTAGEAIPGIFKGIGAASEYVNPKQFVQNMGKDIQKNADFATQQASDVYQPVLDKFGNYHIDKNNPSQEYNGLDDSIKDYFGPDLKKMDSQFSDKPTLQNAHDLQSQLGSEIGKLNSSKDAATRNTVQALSQARGALRNDMFGFLNARNPDSANQYQAGTDIYRAAVAPFKTNKYISDISQGKVSDIEPNKLLKALTNVQDVSNIKPGHWLTENQQDLSNRMANAKAASNILGLIGGGAGLGFGGPMGAALGGMAGKFLGPSTLQLAQNPNVVKALGVAKNAIYDPLRTASIANILGGQ